MSSVQGLVGVVGRLLLCAIFLIAAAGQIVKFKEITQLMEKVGVPQPQILLVGAIVFLAVGSISVLVGYQARIGALLLILFLALATYYFHDFWNVNRERVLQKNEGFGVLSDKDIELQVKKEQEGQTIDFLKNLALMGAMLLIVANGAGAWSADTMLARKPGAVPRTDVPYPPT
jgi:putative oxidoreductase